MYKTDVRVSAGDMNCRVNNATYVKNVIERGTREESQIILAQAKRDRSTHNGLTVKEREWKTVTASLSAIDSRQIVQWTYRWKDI